MAGFNLNANCRLRGLDLMTFYTYTSLKWEKVETFDKNRDPNGQKGPYRDPGTYGSLNMDPLGCSENALPIHVESRNQCLVIWSGFQLLVGETTKQIFPRKCN